MDLTPAEEQELNQRLERKQMTSFMQTYQTFVQRCFDDCINDFTSKSMGSREEGCVLRCIDKLQKASTRISQRFQEQSQEIQGKMA